MPAENGVPVEQGGNRHQQLPAESLAVLHPSPLVIVESDTATTQFLPQNRLLGPEFFRVRGI